MKVGYARVSTKDQVLDGQIDALNQSGCERIFTDRASGVREDRLGLKELMSFIRKGDTLVIWKLDRLGRGLKHLISFVEDLRAKGIGLKSLTEDIDTTSPGGALIFNVFASIAQFERDIIKERTRIGLSAAKARGRMGGRKLKLSREKINHAVELYRSNSKTISEICNIIGISRAQFYEYMRKEGIVSLSHKSVLEKQIYGG